MMGPSTLSTRVRTLGLKSMAQVHKSTPVAPSSPLRWYPYLGLKTMAQIHKLTLTVDLKPTPVAQVDANGRTQAHSGGTSRR
jgi:hypothetical protein